MSNSPQQTDIIRILSLVLKGHASCSMRSMPARVFFIFLFAMLSVGCSNTTQTVGTTLIAGGLLMAGTGTVLSAGCTNSSSQAPSSRHETCLPDETWNRTKPFILTRLVTGVILAATGVAVIAADDTSKAPQNQSSQGTQPSMSRPRTDSGCKESTFCY